MENNNKNIKVTEIVLAGQGRQCYITGVEEYVGDKADIKTVYY